RDFFQDEIQEASYKWQTDVDAGKRIIVGVNRYQVEEPPLEGLMKIDPALQAAQVQRLRDLRARRDPQIAEAAVERLRNAASATDNLMPRIIECVEALCTLGEISDALRAVFGVYKEHFAP